MFWVRLLSSDEFQVQSYWILLIVIVQLLPKKSKTKMCILHLIHGNVMFDIFESHAFQK